MLNWENLVDGGPGYQSSSPYNLGLGEVVDMSPNWTEHIISKDTEQYIVQITQNENVLANAALPSLHTVREHLLALYQYHSQWDLHSRHSTSL